MTIDEITEKIIESKNNDIAKAFTMQIGSLLTNNGIVPVMTEYTVTDIKNITNRNEHKLFTEYGVAFKELDCSKHDKEIYNRAVDDLVEKVELKYLGVHPDELYEKYYPREICLQVKEIAEQLKAGETE